MIERITPQPGGSEVRTSTGADRSQEIPLCKLDHSARCHEIDRRLCAAVEAMEYLPELRPESARFVAWTVAHYFDHHLGRCLADALDYLASLNLGTTAPWELNLDEFVGPAHRSRIIAAVERLLRT